jgi:CheY-like chemotaxis protein
MAVNQQEKPCVVIVEDVSENLRILVELLKTDYRVIPVKDGETALTKIAPPFPDLVLLDIVMPGLDGYEVCRRLKENSKTRHIPVIFITAISEVMDKAKAFEIGAVDYITKPFNPLTVKARIRTHIELSKTMKALQQALKKIKKLNGLIPICSSCKKIRDDKGYWNLLEAYIEKHSDAFFSHGICPECSEKLYGKQGWYIKRKK